MHCRRLVFTLLIALLMLNSAEAEARPVPSALDSTDRVTYTYDGDPVFFGPANATVEIEVPDVFNINDVDILVSIEHTYDFDVTLRLESPSGVQVILVSEVGHSEDNFLNTVFNDDATVPIINGEAPFTGSFRPVEPLSAFNGETGTGTWTLHLDDRFPFEDDGTLTVFELTLGGRIGGTLLGRVVSLETQQPLSGVRLEYLDTPNFAITDEQGYYALLSPVGTFDLLVSYPFWCSQRVDSIVLAQYDTLDYNFELGKPEAGYSFSSLNILVNQNGHAQESIDIINDGNCELEWSIEIQANWIVANPTSGSIPGGEEFEVELNVSGEQLEVGDYLARLIVNHSAENSPHVIPVFLSVVPSQDAAESRIIPSEFELLGSYPNPFNSATNIRYTLPVVSDVIVKLYSSNGRLVQEINEQGVPAGIHDMFIDLNGSASGVYLAQFQAGAFNGVHKLVLIK